MLWAERRPPPLLARQSAGDAPLRLLLPRPAPIRTPQATPPTPGPTLPEASPPASRGIAGDLGKVLVEATIVTRPRLLGTGHCDAPLRPVRIGTAPAPARAPCPGPGRPSQIATASMGKRAGAAERGSGRSQIPRRGDRRLASRTLRQALPPEHIRGQALRDRRGEGEDRDSWPGTPWLAHCISPHSTHA